MKMLFVVYALMTLQFGCCNDDLKFGIKSVSVGQNVTLICPREDSSYYWIRLVSGNWPEFLGATSYLKHDGVSRTPHIKFKQEEGRFILQIYGFTPSDSGLYYCVQVTSADMIFRTKALLKTIGPESDITTIVQESSSGPISPGDPVTLQCSVVSRPEKKTCSADHRLSWFRAGSDEFRPNLIYAHGNISEECELSLEADSVKKCFYNFSMTISSSDSGTYYCAVATCGEILFGNGTKLDVEESSFWLAEARSVVFLLCVILVLSLIVIVVLMCSVSKKSAAVKLHGECDLNKHERNEERWIYSVVIFSVIQTDNRTVKAAAAESQRIYAAAKTLGNL